MNITLSSLQDTLLLGAAMAKTLTEQPIQAILLYGDLGAGKTTFTKSIVENLQGAEKVEISSPSFTISNIYCTFPPVQHFDLYRLAANTPLDDLAEAFDTSGTVTIVEWAENMHPADAPLSGISCSFFCNENQRMLAITPIGNDGNQFLDLLQKKYDAMK